MPTLTRLIHLPPRTLRIRVLGLRLGLGLGLGLGIENADIDLTNPPPTHSAGKGGFCCHKTSFHSWNG